MVPEEFKYAVPEESKGSGLKDVGRLRKTESILRNVFDRNGYKETIVPMFEYVDLYRSVYEDFDEEKTFKYIGKDGKVIALRWDFTIPIARQHLEKSRTGETSGRYSYFGNIYRKEKAYKGRSPESYQAGIELVNVPGETGDIEVIGILQESLSALDMDDVIVELGSAKIFHRVCELTGEKDKLLGILSKKNISAMESFVRERDDLNSELKELLLKLPRSAGDIHMLEKFRQDVSDEKIIRAIDELREIYEAAEKRENLRFDLGMCPGMEYYTCLMFKAYSRYCPEPIVSGGRYDSLYMNFREDTPAIGMGYYLDNIMAALDERGEKR